MTGGGHEFKMVAEGLEGCVRCGLIVFGSLGGARDGCDKARVIDGNLVRLDDGDVRVACVKRGLDDGHPAAKPLREALLQLDAAVAQVEHGICPVTNIRKAGEILVKNLGAGRIG